MKQFIAGFVILPFIISSILCAYWLSGAHDGHTENLYFGMALFVAAFIIAIVVTAIVRGQIS